MFFKYFEYNIRIDGERKGLERKGDLNRKKKEKSWVWEACLRWYQTTSIKGKCLRAWCRCIETVFKEITANVFHSEWNSIPHYLEMKSSRKQCTL